MSPGPRRINRLGAALLAGIVAIVLNTLALFFLALAYGFARLVREPKPAW